MENATQYFVVDYDIPVEPNSQRMKFYRALWRVLEEHQVPETERSTASVFISGSQPVAEAIHNLASRYGHSNLYQAVKVEEAPAWANTKPLFIEP